MNQPTSKIMLRNVVLEKFQNHVEEEGKKIPQ